MPLFPFVKKILGVSLNWDIAIPIVNFLDISYKCYYYGRRSCIFDLRTHSIIMVLLKKKYKHEMGPESWQMGTGLWGGL